MPLKLMYITNNPQIALIAENSGVDRICVDLETLGKEERQKGINSVKSKHTILDISIISKTLTTSEMLVRVNPWNINSILEINKVIQAGAKIIMLPMWKNVIEVKSFISAVEGRVKIVLLLETKEAVECLDEILSLSGVDEIHIGLNDLHISYGMTFMFELLANGTVEKLCKKIKKTGIPYGFGGIAKIGEGLLPAEKIIMEHYRLGSTRAILSRSFCDVTRIERIEEVERIFHLNMKTLREYELSLRDVAKEDFYTNKVAVAECVDQIVSEIIKARNNVF